MSIHESGEMYLESVLVLLTERGKVRSVDVGDYLGYSKPSVSRAMKILRQQELVTVDSDGYIDLTPEGRKIAETIYERHVVLTKLLVGIGVDEHIAEDDACKVEHVISEETFEAIKKAVNK